MTSGKAPEFELPSLEGGQMSLRNLLASGPVVLAFFKVTCPTCQMTFPFLERLHRGGGGDAPRVIAISQDDAAATAKFNRTYGVTFTGLLDTKGYPVSNAYGITNVPTLFVVEQDGNISRAFAGFDQAEIQRLAARAGVEVFTATDRVPLYQPG